ncbi:hypothetical protein POSPLADRAFT_1149890, partial [Postia placenta MAD-698-R-SB12]
CKGPAREAIRLTFHDGIGRSATLAASGTFGGGGADGSIIKFADSELADPANDGLEDIVYALKSFADNHGVSYGDIIQFAGAVALSNCPGSPRLAFYAGRPQAIAPSPPGLIPSPTDSVKDILARMSDAGFTPDDTVALLAAHSVAVQNTVDPTIPDTPLDSTPELFDTQFYLETLLRGTTYPGTGRNTAGVKSPSKHLFRLASDAAIARDARTACRWQSFAHDQEALRTSFRNAMLKLANQGFEGLINCSFIIPESLPHWKAATFPYGTNASDIEHSCPSNSSPEGVIPDVSR